MKNSFIIIIGILILIFSCSSFAQESQIRQVPSRINTIDKIQFDIKVHLKQKAPDDRGTDVTNIYEITVDLEAPNAYTQSNPNSYKIIYFLDGVQIESFSYHPLPFSFTRNFKGQFPGEHEMKIEVEDDQNNILARATIPIIVRKSFK